MAVVGRQRGSACRSAAVDGVAEAAAPHCALVGALVEKQAVPGAVLDLVPPESIPAPFPDVARHMVKPEAVGAQSVNWSVQRKAA